MKAADKKAILDEVARGFRSVRNAAKILDLTPDEVQILVWGELRQ